MHIRNTAVVVALGVTTALLAPAGTAHAAPDPKDVKNVFVCDEITQAPLVGKDLPVGTNCKPDRDFPETNSSLGAVDEPLGVYKKTAERPYPAVVCDRGAYIPELPLVGGKVLGTGCESYSYGG